MYSISTDTFI